VQRKAAQKRTVRKKAVQKRAAHQVLKTKIHNQINKINKQQQSFSKNKKLI
jgi:hypothetical protein